MTTPLHAHVGAYAISRAHRTWDSDEEERLFERLEADTRIAGLELPWLGSLHPHDDAWLMRRLPERFTGIVTSIPGLMTRLADDPDHGLASTDAKGRAAAVAEGRRVAEAVRRWHDRAGRRVVIAVELHAGPRTERADEAALARSLAELSQEDWGGADVVLEHCDALRPGQSAEKGFLPLEAELRALAEAPDSWGLSLNWGRSAIELRDPSRVPEHAAIARESGRLRGLMLSGAASEPSVFGPAWVDAHLPFRRDVATPAGEPASLLTVAAASALLDAAGSWRWWGVKVGCADPDADLAARAAIVGQALNALERAAGGRRPVQATSAS